MEIILNLAGSEYKAAAVESNRVWGHGVLIKIYDGDGGELYRCRASNHPEFDDYDLYQAKSFSELVQEVKRNLESSLDLDSMKRG